MFRGVHPEITLDASGSSGQVGFVQDEILVKQITNHAAGGLPSFYDDLAYAIVPTSTQNGPVLLQMAGYENEFLDETYTNGSDGSLFEYEIIYYQQQTVNGNPESLKLTVPNGVIGTSITNLGNDSDKYRWNFQLKNNRDADDYSGLIAMAQTFSLTGSAFLSAVSSVIDVDQWLRTFAAANLMGIGDTYLTGGNKHNVMFYQRPSDGKMLMLPYDWDVCFTGSTTAGLVLNSDLSKLLASPDYQHAYYGHLQDIINTSANAAYLSSWSSHYGGLVGQSYSPDVTFVQNRANSVTSQLAIAAAQIPFAITTNGGADFSIAALSTNLAGNGWINVREIRLAGDSQPLPLVWTAVNAWQVTVPLSYGANHLALEAYDFQGNLIGTDTIVVTSTLPDPRQADALRITEIMYHPSPSPPGGAFDREEFEYIEIQNISATPISLEGAKLEDGVSFTFPAMTLNPGQFVVVVENQAAFTSRYAGPITIAGQYAGKLDNAGELLTFRAVTGEVIHSFTYGDDDWYPPTDGPGYSLVIVDPLADPSTWGQPSSWRVSTNVQGSPGEADLLYLDADVNQDGMVDIFDINLVSAHWGEAGPAGDANSDGAVDIFDINLISASWGTLPGGGGGGGAGAGASDAAEGSSTGSALRIANQIGEPGDTAAPLNESPLPHGAPGSTISSRSAGNFQLIEWQRQRADWFDPPLVALAENAIEPSRQAQIGRLAHWRPRVVTVPFERMVERVFAAADNESGARDDGPRRRLRDVKQPLAHTTAQTDATDLALAEWTDERLDEALARRWTPQQSKPRPAEFNYQRQVERSSSLITAPVGQSPRRSEMMFCAASIAMSSSASLSLPAMWGLSTTLDMLRNGWSGGGGSFSSTSRPAPARWPLRSAATRSFSATTPPRAVLMSTLSGCIRSSAARLIIPRVASHRGQCRLI